MSRSNQLAHLMERRNKETFSKGKVVKYIMKETAMEKHEVPWNKKAIM